MCQIVILLFLSSLQKSKCVPVELNRQRRSHVHGTQSRSRNPRKPTTQIPHPTQPHGIPTPRTQPSPPRDHSSLTHDIHPAMQYGQMLMRRFLWFCYVAFCCSVTRYAERQGDADLKPLRTLCRDSSGCGARSRFGVCCAAMGFVDNCICVPCVVKSLRCSHTSLSTSAITSAVS